MPHTYAHMCRDGHTEIGHNDSDSGHELCPLCRALNEIEQLRKDVARWKTEYEYERHNHHAVIDRHNEIMDEIGKP